MLAIMRRQLQGALEFSREPAFSPWADLSRNSWMCCLSFSTAVEHVPIASDLDN